MDGHPLRRLERANLNLFNFPANAPLTTSSAEPCRQRKERIVISTARLDELKSEVGADDFAEIVSLFIAESDGIVGRLGGASTAAEAEELLHALKGSALNLGFDDLAALCREGEGREAGSAGWRTRVDRIVAVYEASKISLSALA
jgi:HPt (histidine-containing phosphotransfer) domain-containing protein